MLKLCYYFGMLRRRVCMTSLQEELIVFRTVTRQWESLWPVLQFHYMLLFSPSHLSLFYYLSFLLSCTLQVSMRCLTVCHTIYFVFFKNLVVVSHYNIPIISAAPSCLPQIPEHKEQNFVVVMDKCPHNKEWSPLIGN